MSSETLHATGEHADLLAGLRQHRSFLRHTLRDLTDEQVGLAPTVSTLCLGGLIKHVTDTESGWAEFIVEGPDAMAIDDMAATMERRTARFRMQPGDTVAGILDAYGVVADRTDRLVASLPDLGVSHPLPVAPWFEPGARWTARRVVLHIVAETAQHAGHADIIREALDGARTMG